MNFTDKQLREFMLAYSHCTLPQDVRLVDVCRELLRLRRAVRRALNTSKLGDWEGILERALNRRRK